MKRMSKLKLSDLGADKRLNPKALKELKGGVDIMLLDGCQSYVCATQRSGASELCKGGAWCTSYVGG